MVSQVSLHQKSLQCISSQGQEVKTSAMNSDCPGDSDLRRQRRHDEVGKVKLEPE